MAGQARLEFGGLGDAIVFKTSAMPHSLARSLCGKNASLPSPVVLSFQLAGSARVGQDGRSYVLHPGDWCLWDTLLPFETSAITGAVEFLSVTLCPVPLIPSYSACSPLGGLLGLTERSGWRGFCKGL